MTAVSLASDVVLAPHLRGALDLLLIEDVRDERDETVELEALLNESGS